MLDSLDIDFISSDLNEMIQNAEQNLDDVCYDASVVYKTAIEDVKALLSSYLKKTMSDAEFNKRLDEAKAKPMTPKGTDEVVDCYLSISDRIVLSRAQEILIRLAEGMDRDHVAHIDFVEKNKERVSMKPKEYTTNLVNSVARALYEIEKAREIKK